MLLLTRRPPTGLLGNMRALPTGPLADTTPGLADPPFPAAWRLTDSTVTHAFTHFDLELALAVAPAPAQEVAGEWWPLAGIEAAGLPTVFLKAALALRSDPCATS